MTPQKKIAFIGAGNVASHLAKAFFSKGFIISNIYSKSLKNALNLAKETNAKACNNLSELTDENHIYIISVNDDAIPTILNQLHLKSSLIVHTSGSVNMNVFAKYGYNNYGIFYPLQTFSKGKALAIKEVPFCIEANTKENETILIDLAKSLSNHFQLINSEQRKVLHLAAVFACNFSNNMYAIANDILQQNGMDLNLLKPLIKETAHKIEHNSPKEVQTGPAIRNDQEVIKNHLQMLVDSKDYQDIYQIITNNIIKNK